MEDKEIVELYWKRDEQALTETSDKYGKQLNRLAWQILHNMEEAEECVNDTYFATWNSLPPNRPTYFWAYIAKIVRNFSYGKIDYHMAKKRSATVVELSAELENCIPNPNDLDRKMESEAIGKVLSDFLYQQPKELRQMFVRRYWYMDSVKVIAKDFRKSENNVKTILFRMRKSLRNYLEKEGIVL